MSGHCKMKTHGGYSAGHPWYYLLGGAVLSLKQIRDCAKASSYRGYMEEKIEAIAKRAEPKRTEALRKIRAKILDDLRNDISRYRQVVFELHAYRCASAICEKEVISCDDIHVAMSLKHNHIFNNFAHLACLEELPQQQGDLFDY